RRKTGRLGLAGCRGWPFELREGSTGRYTAQHPRTYVVEWSRHELDPLSSAGWFDGWADAPPTVARPTTSGDARGCPIVSAATWLLSRGWRRHGLIPKGRIPGPRLGRKSETS